ncbi:MAG TPA: thioesterase family protein [Thermoleophilaceae bacterium]
MSEPAAVYLPDGDGYRPTELARGPWDPDAQHGGAPAALLARAIEREAGELGVVRLTLEFLRPVPLEPLVLSTREVRPGRRARLTEATLEAAGTPVCRALGLALARTEGAAPAVPPETEPLPPPDGVEPSLPPPGGRPMFSGGGVELRFVRGAFTAPGPAAAWIRFRVPLVEGETPTPLQRAVAAADFGNGVSAALDWNEHVFINPDLTVYLGRPPRGEWVGLDSRTTVETGGVGLASSVLHDAHGAIGYAAQALVVGPRGNPPA